MTPHTTKPKIITGRTLGDVATDLIERRPIFLGFIIFIGATILLGFCIVFAPEIKAALYYHFDIPISHEAKATTEIMEKLDAQKAALDSTGRIGYRVRNNRMDSTLTHISLVMDTLADMMRYTPTGKKMNGEYKELLRRRWELNETIGFNPHRTEEVK